MAGELNVIVKGNGTVLGSRVGYVSGSKIADNERKPSRLLFTGSEENLTRRTAEKMITGGNGRPRDGEMFEFFISPEKNTFQKLGQTKEEREKGFMTAVRAGMKEMFDELGIDSANYVAGIHQNTNHQHAHVLVLKHVIDVDGNQKVLNNIPYGWLRRENGENSKLGEIFSRAFRKQTRHIPPSHIETKLADPELFLPKSADKNSKRWSETVRLYSKVRHINPANIESLTDNGSAYINGSGGITFVRRDANGKPTGYTNESGYHGDGDEKGFFYIGNAKNATNFLLVDTPKEALAIWQLTGHRDLSHVCIATADNGQAPAEFINAINRASLKNSTRVIWALNLDRAGKQNEDALTKLSETLIVNRDENTPALEIVKATPKTAYGHSWHNQLFWENSQGSLQAQFRNVIHSRDAKIFKTLDAETLEVEKLKEEIIGRELFDKVTTSGEDNIFTVKNKSNEKEVYGTYNIERDAEQIPFYAVTKINQESLAAPQKFTIETDAISHIESEFSRLKDLEVQTDATVDEETEINFSIDEAAQEKAKKVIEKNKPKGVSLENLTGRIRELTIEEVGPLLGLFYRRKDNSWIDQEGKNKTHKIEVKKSNPGEWNDRVQGFYGSYGMIDLVKHVNRCEFIEARDFLFSYFEPDWREKLKQYYDSKPLSDFQEVEEDRLRIPPPNTKNLDQVLTYLEDRKINSNLLAIQTVTKDLYANSYASAVFVHRSPDGEITGASWRATDGHIRNDVPGSDMEKGWYHIGDMNTAARYVIVRDPVEAMSYYTLYAGTEKMNKTAVIGLGYKAREIPDALYKFINERVGAELVVALDDTKKGNDEYFNILEKGGRLGQLKNKELHEKQEFDNGDFIGKITREIPRGGADWNETLQSAAYEIQSANDQEHASDVLNEEKLEDDYAETQVKSSDEIKQIESEEIGNEIGWSRYAADGENSYEVSNAGDRRFSALNARFQTGESIEEAYQFDVKKYRQHPLIAEAIENGKSFEDIFYDKDLRPIFKGQPPLEDFSEDAEKSKEILSEKYVELWDKWANENKYLMNDLQVKTGEVRLLTDKFAQSENNQARALSILLGKKDWTVEQNQTQTPVSIYLTEQLIPRIFTRQDERVTYLINHLEKIQKENYADAEVKFSDLEQKAMIYAERVETETRRLERVLKRYADDGQEISKTAQILSEEFQAEIGEELSAADKITAITNFVENRLDEIYSDAQIKIDEIQTLGADNLSAEPETETGKNNKVKEDFENDTNQKQEETSVRSADVERRADEDLRSGRKGNDNESQTRSRTSRSAEEMEKSGTTESRSGTPRSVDGTGADGRVGHLSDGNGQTGDNGRSGRDSESLRPANSDGIDRNGSTAAGRGRGLERNQTNQPGRRNSDNPELKVYSDLGIPSVVKFNDSTGNYETETFTGVIDKITRQYSPDGKNAFLKVSLLSGELNYGLMFGNRQDIDANSLEVFEAIINGEIKKGDQLTVTAQVLQEVKSKRLESKSHLSIPSHTLELIKHLAPKQEKILIEQMDHISRDFVRANPKNLFLFGDNMERSGFGGQAKEMRGEDNSFGIPTKKIPSQNEQAFLTDNELEENIRAIDAAFDHLVSRIESGQFEKLIIPASGIGTGLAQLEEKAPETFKYLQTKIGNLYELYKAEDLEISETENTAENSELPKTGHAEVANDKPLANSDEPALASTGADNLSVEINEAEVLRLSEKAESENDSATENAETVEKSKEEPKSLLLPETLDLSVEQLDNYEKNKDALREQGFDTIRLSGRTVAIKTIPADTEIDKIREDFSALLDNEKIPAESPLEEKEKARKTKSNTLSFGSSLVPDKILNTIPTGKVKSEEAMAHVKLFHPASDWTWYISEAHPITAEGGKEIIDIHFYGFVQGFEGEYGYFSLSELEEIKVRGLKIERDLYYKPQLLTEVASQYKKARYAEYKPEISDTPPTSKSLDELEGDNVEVIEILLKSKTKSDAENLIDELSADQGFVAGEILGSVADENNWIVKGYYEPEAETYGRAKLDLTGNKSTRNRAISSSYLDKLPVQAKTPEDKLREQTLKDQYLTPDNYRFTDLGIHKGGEKQKFRQNVEAIRIINELEKDERHATPEEMEVLAKFVGWGAVKEPFNYNVKGNWQEERELLKELMDDESFGFASRVTANAHHTSIDVAAKIWQAIDQLGFSGGRILEPAVGSGNFLGTVPDQIGDNSKFYGCDIDPTSLKVAQALYPRAELVSSPYEKTKWKDDIFDLVVTNVPFGNHNVADLKYKALNPSIHNYFLLKSLDQTRPGGLVVALTSRYTLDAQDTRIREALAARAELVGAVRLPDNAFKENAGTEVVTDLLIFRKREIQLEIPLDEKRNPLPPTIPEGELNWLDTKLVDNPDYDESDEKSNPELRINEVYADNPDLILGKLSGAGKMYFQGDLTIKSDGQFDEKFLNFVSNLPKDLYQSLSAAGSAQIQNKLDAKDWIADGLKTGNYFVEDEKVYQVEPDGSATEIKYTDKQRLTLEKLLSLKDTVNEIYGFEIDGSEEALAEAETIRVKLNKDHALFTKEFGAIKSKSVSRLLDGDPDASKVVNLEKAYNEKTGKIEKADIFFKATVSPILYLDTADSITDAVGASLNKYGNLNLEYMAQLRGANEAEIRSELIEKDLAFENPSKNAWETADVYLSGNVKDKLANAVEIAGRSRDDEKLYSRNIKALGAVIPEDIPYVDIDINLGSSMMTVEDMKDFVKHLTKADNYEIIVEYAPRLGRWAVGWQSNTSARQFRNSEASTAVWGTKDRDVLNLLEIILQGKDATVKRTYEDKETGQKITYVDQDATSLAEQKINDIKAEFKDWIWADNDRRQRIHQEYNDTRNNTVTWKPDGSHLTLKGLNPEITPYAHQLDYTWRSIVQPSDFAAHEVGTGKTLSMAFAAMEQKRLGLVNKPAMLCLKANIHQITAEARKAYPHARIFSLDEHFSTSSRQDAAAIIANNDFDLVIMTYEQVKKLPVSSRTVNNYLQQEMAELTTTISEAIESEGKKSRLAGQLRRRQRNLEAKIETLILQERDESTTFEQTGIDYFFVDEGHNFKALPIYTTLQNLKGVPSTRSDRAVDLHIRTEYLRERFGKPRISPATGTAITNTVAEVYNWMRFCAPDTLSKNGISSFDTFVREYTEVVRKLEPTATGGYKMQNRLAKYINLPEMRTMMSGFFDVVTAQEAGIKRPESRTFVVGIPISQAQINYRESLQVRASNLGRVDPRDDNYFKISSDGEKMSMDMRLVDIYADDAAVSKADVIVANGLRKLKEQPNTVQLIFSDLGIHPNKQTGFSVFDEIEKQLISAGVPPERIANISKLNKEKSREAIDKARTGEIIFLMGSTQRLGTGVNPQTFVSAIHNADTSWLPAAITQRIGRGVRQGNILTETGVPVDVYNYVTVGGFDEIKWEANARKATFINQVVTNKISGRTFSDRAEDGFSPAEIAAVASGNDDVRRQVEIGVETNELVRREKLHRQNQLDMRDNLPSLEKDLEISKILARDYAADLELYSVQKVIHIGKIEEVRAKAKKDFDTAQVVFSAMEKDEKTGADELENKRKELAELKELKDTNFMVTLDGTEYFSRESAAKKLGSMFGVATQSGKLGSYMGFDIRLEKNESNRLGYGLFTSKINLVNPETNLRHQIAGDQFIDYFSNFERSAFSRLKPRKEMHEKKTADKADEIEQVQKKIDNPFPDMETLKANQAELVEIEKRLKEFNQQLQRERELAQELEIIPVGDNQDRERAAVIKSEIKRILEETPKFEIGEFVSKAHTEAAVRGIAVVEVEAMYAERAGQGINDEEAFSEADEELDFDEETEEQENLFEMEAEDNEKSVSINKKPLREKTEKAVNSIKETTERVREAVQHSLFGDNDEEVMASYQTSGRFEKISAAFRDEPLEKIWFRVSTESLGKGRLLLDPAAFELVRRAYIKADIGTKDKDFAGTFNEPEAIDKIIASLADLSNENHYFENTFNVLIASINEARNERGGTITFLRNVKALEHEAMHEGSFYASKGVEIEDRHARFTELREHEAFRAARPALIEEGGYPRNDAILLEELAAHCVPGEYEKLGLGKEQAKSYLKLYFESIVEKNGVISLKEFQEINDESAKIRDEVYQQHYREKATLETPESEKSERFGEIDRSLSERKLRRNVRQTGQREEREIDPLQHSPRLLEMQYDAMMKKKQVFDAARENGVLFKTTDAPERNVTEFDTKLSNLNRSFGNEIVKRVELAEKQNVLEKLNKESDEQFYQIEIEDGFNRFFSIKSLEIKARVQARDEFERRDATGEAALLAFQQNKKDWEIKREIKAESFAKAVSEQSDIRSQINSKHAEKVLEAQEEYAVLSRELTEIENSNSDSYQTLLTEGKDFDIDPFINSSILWKLQEEAARRGDTESFELLEEVHQLSGGIRTNKAAANLKGWRITADTTARVERQKSEMATEDFKERYFKFTITNKNGELEVINRSLTTIEEEKKNKSEYIGKTKNQALRGLLRPLEVQINPLSKVQGTLSWFTDPAGTLNTHLNPIEVIKNDPAMQIIRAAYNFSKSIKTAQELSGEMKQLDGIEEAIKNSIEKEKSLKAEKATKFEATTEAIDNALNSEEAAREAVIANAGEANITGLEMPKAYLSKYQVKQVLAGAQELQDNDLIQKITDIVEKNAEFAQSIGYTAEKGLASSIVTKSEAIKEITESVTDAQILEDGSIEVTISESALTKIGDNLDIGDRAQTWIDKLLDKEPGIKPDFTENELTRMEQISESVVPSTEQALLQLKDYEPPVQTNIQEFIADAALSPNDINGNGQTINQETIGFENQPSEIKTFDETAEANLSNGFDETILDLSNVPSFTVEDESLAAKTKRLEFSEAETGLADESLTENGLGGGNLSGVEFTEKETAEAIAQAAAEEESAAEAIELLAL